MNKLIFLLLFCIGCRGEFTYSSDPFGCGYHHGTMLNNMPPGEFNKHMKEIHGKEFGRDNKKCPIDHLKLHNLDNGSLEDHLKHCILFEQEEIKFDKSSPETFPQFYKSFKAPISKPKTIDKQRQEIYFKQTEDELNAIRIIHQ